MCTMTYLPFADGSFILTTNRDESPLRARALAPQIRKFGEGNVLYPVDGHAGGTWVAVGDNRRTVCLLNGAFAPHEMGGKYRLSRGIMVLESFEYENTMAFLKRYDFMGIEPFTYIAVEGGRGDRRITELRWDAYALHRREFPADQPAIWSSAQLYKPKVIAQRESWFRKWLLEHEDYDLGKIQQFHGFAGEGDVYNDLRMNRLGMVRTVSTTAIENRDPEIKMHHEDLLSGKMGIVTMNTGLAG